MKTLKIIIVILLLSFGAMVFCEMSTIYDLATYDAKWAWIREKIIKEDRKIIDYVFIGGSRMWLSLIPQRVIEKMGPDVKVWNMGRNFSGPDADYIIARHLLAHHNVKHLIVEFNNEKEAYEKSHPYTKYVVSPKDVWDEIVFLCKTVTFKEALTYSESFKKKIAVLAEHIGEIAVGTPRRAVIDLKNALEYLVTKRKPAGNDWISSNERTLGYYASDDDFKQNPKFIEEAKNIKIDFPIQKGTSAFPKSTRIEYYTEKMKVLADRYNTKLSFVYQPTYADSLPSDEAYAHYSRLGNVYFPNLKKLYKIEYWRDSAHLNKKGAVVFTDEMVTFLSGGPKGSMRYGFYAEIY